MATDPTAPQASDPPGLTGAQAVQRLAEEGPNALPGGQRRGLLDIAAETVREPMFALLLIAGTLYLVLGDWHEGLTLFGFVLITLALTLVQEGRTERAIDALRDLTSPRALVIRDGQPRRIAGRDVVRGDLIRLSEGDRVPADAWLLSGAPPWELPPAWRDAQRRYEFCNNLDGACRVLRRFRQVRWSSWLHSR